MIVNVCCTIAQITKKIDKKCSVQVRNWILDSEIDRLYLPSKYHIILEVNQVKCKKSCTVSCSQEMYVKNIKNI